MYFVQVLSLMYFVGLAVQIIRLYPNLADAVNQDGFSPLHILAMKPNCFQSSTRMEFMDRMIYNCKNTSYQQDSFATFFLKKKFTFVHVRFLILTVLKTKGFLIDDMVKKLNDIWLFCYRPCR